MINKFDPKPGDKIICNNGKEFICCTKEQLKMCIDGIFETKDIVGLTKDGRRWQDWNADGTSCLGYYNNWAIREVIPQNSEVTDDKKEEVKEEPRYTVEEVLEAIQLVTPNEAPWNWVPEIKEHLNKAKDPQYLEYLRLKAIYE